MENRKRQEEGREERRVNPGILNGDVAVGRAKSSLRSGKFWWVIYLFPD